MSAENNDDLPATLCRWQARFAALQPQLAALLPPPGLPFASNAAYRAAVRALFDMDADARTAFGLAPEADAVPALALDPAVPLDPETDDELRFDGAQATRVLHDWFLLTEDDAEFLTLYDYLGYRFLVTNPETGFAALLNFDDLAPFCRALSAFVLSLQLIPGGGGVRGGRHAPELHALLNKYRPEDR